jgi:hypothetical protein
MRAESDSLRDAVLAAARDSLFHAVVSRIIPRWYGTAWGYQGMTEVPRSGSIACGYFVTTVLRDAGLKISRIWLAQQASEVMIKTLLPKKYIKKFRRVSLAKFIAAVKAWGVGLYVVGLDRHTGFIVYDGQEVYFIHSSLRTSYSVVCEGASESLILSKSAYRVLGKLSESDRLLQRWLKGERISRHDRSRRRS